MNVIRTVRHGKRLYLYFENGMIYQTPVPKRDLPPYNKYQEMYRRRKQWSNQ